MLIVDRALLALAREILAAARAEQPTPERLHARLRELHRSLEEGALTEEEFESDERDVLDALDALEAQEEVLEEGEPDPDEGDGRGRGQENLPC